MHQAWSFPPLDVGTVLVAERRALLDIMGGCSPEDWRRPTACPAWTVHGVVAHVVHDDLRCLSGSRDGHGGAPFTGDDEDLGAWLATRNEVFVDGFADCSPRLLLDLLRWLGPQAHAHFSEVPPYQPATAVAWAGASPMAPAWLHVAREYTERWMHQHQIRRALGLAPLFAEEFVTPLLAAWRWSLVPVLPQLDADTFALAVDDRATWRYGRDGERWLVCDDALDAPAAPDAASAAVDATIGLDGLIEWLTSSRRCAGPGSIPAALHRARAIVV